MDKRGGGSRKWRIFISICSVCIILAVVISILIFVSGNQKSSDGQATDISNQNNKEDNKDDHEGPDQTSEEGTIHDLADDTNSQSDKEPAPEVKVNDYKIKIWSQTSDLADLIKKYKDAHPDFEYEMIDEYYTSYAMVDGNYGQMLKERLESGEHAPDIYCVSDIYAEEFCSGEASKYAIAYDDIGIDCATAIKEAEIAPYIIAMGTNRETGKIMALSPECNGAAFAYRRSIAKAVWGTDDPDVIAEKIGPDWEHFLGAAEELKKKGYYIVSGADEVLRPMMGNVKNAWFTDGRLNIDQKRMDYVDYAKIMTDSGYHGGGEAWSEEWYLGMSSDQVFGYFAPSWMIRYTIDWYCHGLSGNEQEISTYGDWAVCIPPESYANGTRWILVNKDSNHLDVIDDIIYWATLDTSDTGLQYRYASGEYEEEQFWSQSVSSGVVMSRINRPSDLLGGQNMFEVYQKINEDLAANPFSQLEDSMNMRLNAVTESYLNGEITRDQVIAKLEEEAKTVAGWYGMPDQE